MRISKCTLIAAGVVLGISSFAIASPRRHATKKSHSHVELKRTSSKRHAVSHSAAHHEMVSVAMPSERATQIQTALIKQGYMTGEPSGAWDSQTIAAMQKMQADNGWQSKVTPDSRALIKLGLGPQSPETALNQTNIATQTSPH
jgi:hypothetical protein